MGSADRKMHRAVEALDRTYASALQPHRMDLARGRAILDDPAGDRAGAIEGLAELHRRALRAALGAASSQGGPGWMTRAVTDEARLSARLWSEHIAPFTGVEADEVPDTTHERPGHERAGHERPGSSTQ